jgi:predicted PurR-regulated permease PerM
MDIIYIFVQNWKLKMKLSKPILFAIVLVIVFVLFLVLGNFKVYEGLTTAPPKPLTKQEKIDLINLILANLNNISNDFKNKFDLYKKFSDSTDSLKNDLEKGIEDFIKNLEDNHDKMLNDLCNKNVIKKCVKK